MSNNSGFHNLKASLSEGSAGRKFRIKNGVSENPSKKLFIRHALYNNNLNKRFFYD